MKYIFRTLWLIGYIFIFIFELFFFFISILIYPIVGGFYFVATGNVENTPFNIDSLPIYIDKKYKELVKYM